MNTSLQYLVRASQMILIGALLCSCTSRLVRKREDQVSLRLIDPGNPKTEMPKLPTFGSGKHRIVVVRHFAPTPSTEVRTTGSRSQRPPELGADEVGLQIDLDSASQVADTAVRGSVTTSEFIGFLPGTPPAPDYRRTTRQFSVSLKPDCSTSIELPEHKLTMVLHR